MASETLQASFEIGLRRCTAMGRIHDVRHESAMDTHLRRTDLTIHVTRGLWLLEMMLREWCGGSGVGSGVGRKQQTGDAPVVIRDVTQGHRW